MKIAPFLIALLASFSLNATAQSPKASETVTMNSAAQRITLVIHGGSGDTVRGLTLPDPPWMTRVMRWAAEFMVTVSEALGLCAAAFSEKLANSAVRKGAIFMTTIVLAGGEQITATALESW